MTYTTVVIPLSHYQPKPNSFPTITKTRSYASEELVETLERIAGKGCRVCQDDIKSVERLFGVGFKWCWMACGKYTKDFTILCRLNEVNFYEDMEIFFKEPEAAMLFKLSWPK